MVSRSRLQPFCFSRTRLSLQISSHPYFSRCCVGTDSIHWLKKPLSPGIELTPHTVVRVSSVTTSPGEIDVMWCEFIANPYCKLPSWCPVRSYRPHLEERDPIWGDDWLYSPFIRQSPSWGFLGFSSAVRQMPGDLCTAPRIISLSPLSLATDTRGKWPLARNPYRSFWHRHTSWKFFWPQPIAPWTAGRNEC